MMQRCVAWPCSSNSFLAASPHYWRGRSWMRRNGAVQCTASIASHCFCDILCSMPSHVNPARNVDAVSPDLHAKPMPLHGMHAYWKAQLQSWPCTCIVDEDVDGPQRHPPQPSHSGQRTPLQ